MTATITQANGVLPIIRTNNARAQTQRLLTNLRDSFATPPVVIYDARAGALDFGDHPSSPLTAQIIAGLQLGDLPDNWGWLCGDLWYYAAVEAFPGHRAYMLMDDDVHLSSQAARRLAEATARFVGDAAASGLSNKFETTPRYSRGLKNIGLDPKVGCIFPLSIATPRLVAAMQGIRRNSLTQSDAINDEAVFATAAFSSRFDAVALEDLLPDQIAPDSFATNPPHLAEVLLETPQDLRIWHPVVSFDTVIERIQSGEKAYTKHRLRKVLNRAPKPLKQQIYAALQGAAAVSEDAAPDVAQRE